MERAIRSIDAKVRLGSLTKAASILKCPGGETIRPIETASQTFLAAVFNCSQPLPLKGLPQRLQYRAEASFCCAPHEGQFATVRLAPHDEQKPAPVELT